MKQWWAARDARERRTLMLGALIVAAVLLYSAVWQPLDREVGRLRSAVTKQEADLAWMRRAATQIKTLQAGAGTHRGQGASQSLLSLVDSSSRSAGLNQVIRRLEPQGADQVQVWVEGASFDDLARWLVQLRRQAGIEVALASVTRQGTPGLVNARLTLARPEAGKP